MGVGHGHCARPGTLDVGGRGDARRQVLWVGVRCDPDVAGAREAARGRCRSDRPDQSSWCITCRPTRPWLGWSKASGTVPMTVKPNAFQSVTAGVLVSTTALNCMLR